MREHNRPSPGGWHAKVAGHFAAHPFVAPRALRNGHAMTIFANAWADRQSRRRPILAWPCERREFATEPGVRVVAFCHWQGDRRARPTAIIIHGLEGSAGSRYVLGTAEKAFLAGLNVLRLNVRNCGGTEALTPTLYHSGLTADLRHLTRELIERDGLPQIVLIGFSMGGNQALKLAGELGAGAPRELRGVCAISPPIDLSLCSRAIGRPGNRFYEARFLSSLKATFRRKHALFPDQFRPQLLAGVRRLWDFDDLVTAPHFGFRDALDYYTQASSLRFIPRVRIPALIIQARDDPFIPFGPFADPALASNPAVTLITPRHGGHVGFFGRPREGEDRYWAENRAVAFATLVSGG